MMAVTASRHIVIGFVFSLLTVLLWSHWLVLSRHGITVIDVYIYDIILLRYGLAAIVVTPFIYKYWPRHQPLYRIIIMALLCGGLAYTLPMLYGLKQVNILEAGLYSNGLIGLCSLLILWLWRGQTIQTPAYIGVGLSLIGCFLSVYDSNYSWGFTYGHLFLIMAAIAYGLYSVCVSAWHMVWYEILVITAVINGLLAVILWGINIQDTTLWSVAWPTLLYTALFQGLGPSILGVIWSALAIYYIGSLPFSVTLAAVPAISTLLAFIWLDETPSLLPIIGLISVTCGIIITVLYSKKPH